MVFGVIQEMNNCDYDQTDERYRCGPRFNKEKFCKKNRQENGQYGFHSYKMDRCVYCNKIDPRLKSKYTRNEESNNEFTSTNGSR